MSLRKWQLIMRRSQMLSLIFAVFATQLNTLKIVPGV